MGVRYLASRGIALRPPAGWPIAVLMLMAALAWPAMMWPAAPSTRATGDKPQPNAKAAHRGGGTSTATALAVVRELRFWSNPSYTRVVIESDGAVQYRVGRLHNPDRLYLDLFGAQLAPKLQGRPIEVIDHIVSSLRAAQNQREVVRIVMDIRSIRDYHVYTINNPHRLVIDVMGATGSTALQAPSPASMPRQAGIDP